MLCPVYSGAELLGIGRRFIEIRVYYDLLAYLLALLIPDL